VLAVTALTRHERTTIEQEAMGRAASVMSAIDAEVNGSIMALQALAASKNLETGDLRAFRSSFQSV
jgi:sensor domain CHASE-containing protein